ncbi:long-chain base protein [Verticillium alfalfae VaMs.102]|uniref:Long-chain base protein n=1 Tax=Verticillium alfalfae (strain VaMs.102 / ATCC MYA-4576 / FGSC 10136) TaxID=526221 RepID=C9SL60_VERA1|nr:long-chain base protein [Verticillium alfalfae VaMs.102]EEY19428.1 long-chain base protein [Verticillium alfalfae VaMs.102]
MAPHTKLSAWALFSACACSRNQGHDRPRLAQTLIFRSATTTDRADAHISQPMCSTPNGAAERREDDAPPSTTKPVVIDAGLRSQDHYKKAMPHGDTTSDNERARTPALDSYFAITANLGTHTFFMIGLPMLFWYGYASFGKGLVHILAEGVFFTGFIKDLCSLPRPLSPPLHRITMSGSAALEYGFPSTHSTNAVSVALYAILVLRSPETEYSATTKLVLEGLSYFYAISIVVGRLYCGMHGFLDVVVGSVIGALIALGRVLLRARSRRLHALQFVGRCPHRCPRRHCPRAHSPEPVDDCPCFDDSVAFAGVMIGLEYATWNYGRTPYDPFDTNAHNFQSINLGPLGVPVLVARLFFGVFVIFAWREMMKPTLLRALPHLFRLIERAGYSLPRRFFTPASEYKSIPAGSRMDNLIPSVREIVRVAYRERRRRESIGSNGSTKGKEALAGVQENSDDRDGRGAASGVHGGIGEYEKQMGSFVSSPIEESRATDFPSPEQDEAEEKEMFSRLTRPRVRYDVEVVTKLVVYAGIAWLGVGMIPIMFEFVGLGSSHLRIAA